MVKVTNIGKTGDYVYDISLDGTVVDACSMLVAKNTDGFNFRMPDSFRFTDESPYISNGAGRNSEKGKSYTNAEGDVAWFEDKFMPEEQAQEFGGIMKMGLGIDEYAASSTQVKRKNYIDLMPDGSLKLVGNSIKSKKIPGYIEKFLNEGLPLYARGKGKEFIDLYYEYVDRIYNMQIPLKEIASLGKIKTSIDTYKENCKQTTASGTKKARQAWYELAIKHNLDVHMGDTIYYINTGVKKGDGDVVRKNKFFYYQNGEKITYATDKNGSPIVNKKGEKKDLFSYIDSEFKKAKKTNYDVRMKEMTCLEYAKKYYNAKIEEEDELIFNCVLIPQEVIDSETDGFLDNGMIYNREKYIEAFNKKVKPLLVSFHKDMRETTVTSIDKKGVTKSKTTSNILITNPNDRKFYSSEECEMCNGEPMDAKDQDTYEEIMSMDDKEIRFWISVNEKPLFADELGMDWEKIKADYSERLGILQQNGIREEKELFDKIISKMSKSELENFSEEGEIPTDLDNLVDVDTYGNFISKVHNVKLGHCRDILDMLENFDKE